MVTINKQTVAIIVPSILTLIFFIAFVFMTIDRNNINAQFTATQEAHAACKEIARNYITSTSTALTAISTPSLYNRQQAQIAIQSAQDIAIARTDTCLEQ